MNQKRLRSRHWEVAWRTSEDESHVGLLLRKRTPLLSKTNGRRIRRALVSTNERRTGDRSRPR